jgi:hypothetical protein
MFSPSLSKLEEAPETVQNKIWSEILAYALCVDLALMNLRDDQAIAIRNWRRTLLFVSKNFYVSDERSLLWGT